MKQNAIIRIVIWSIVIILLTGLLVSVLFGATLFQRRRTAVTQLTQEEYGNGNGSAFSQASESNVRVSASDIQKISIEWVAGDIHIIAKENVEEIHFSEDAVTDSRYQMVYTISHEELKIKFCKDPIKISGIHLSSELSKDLYLEVPASWVCEELEIDAAAANLTVQDVLIREVDFDGAAGTCDFKNCTIGSLDMDTASGDVTFHGSLNALDFDSASASFFGVFTNTPDRIDMDGMSGDLDITLPEDGGYLATINGMSCTFHAENHEPLKHQDSHSYGSERCRINLDGMSCALTIRISPTEGETHQSESDHH